MSTSLALEDGSFVETDIGREPLPNVFDEALPLDAGNEVVQSVERSPNPLAILLFELLQNACDRQDRDSSEEAGVYYTVADEETGESRRVRFTGHMSEMMRDLSGPLLSRALLGLEVENFCAEGWNPAYAYRQRHGEGEQTIGQHGIGWKLAAALLMNRGIELGIEAHFKNRPWQSQTYAKKDLFLQSSIPHIRGELGPAPKGSTRVRTHMQIPPAHREAFASALLELPNTFLEANPVYGGRLVPKDETILNPPQGIPVGQGFVEPLHEVFPGIKSVHYGYLDGLCLILPWSKDSIIPWNIRGLSRATGPYHVARSKSSIDFIAPNLDYVMACAMRKIEDPNLIQTLLERAVENPGKTFLEFPFLTEETSQKIEFPIANKQLVKTIWENLYGKGTPYCVVHEEEAAVIKHLSAKEPILVSPGLGIFLKAAGILSATVAAAGYSAERLKTPSMVLPWIGEKDALQRILETFAREGGELLQLGQNQIQIRLPVLLKSGPALQSAEGTHLEHAIRMLAIWAHRQGFRNLEIYGHDGSDTYCVDIHANLDLDALEPSHSFTTHVSIHRQENHQKGEKGRTLVELNVEASRAVADIQILQKIRTRFELNRALREALDRTNQENISTRRQNEMPIGQGGMQNPLPELDRAASDLPPGFYVTNIGTQFVLGSDRRVHWENPGIYMSERLPIETFGETSAQIVLREVRRTMHLAVPFGHRIAAFQVNGESQGNWTLHREYHTGVYRLTVKPNLKLGEVVYWTEQDPDFHSRRPLEDESHGLLRDRQELLNRRWRRLIERANQMDGKSKIETVLREWGGRFVYATDLKLDAQVQGTDLQKIVAQMINAPTGICNRAASGATLLSRELGAPSRYLAGIVVNPSQLLSSHGAMGAHYDNLWHFKDPTAHGRSAINWPLLGGIGLAGGAATVIAVAALNGAFGERVEAFPQTVSNIVSGFVCEER